MSLPTPTTRIVILGGGFAGAYCAQRLVRHFKHDPSVQITVLDRHNYFIFYPLLIEAGAGALIPRHISVPIRRFLHRRANLLVGDITAVNLSSREIFFSVFEDPHVEPLPYDHLVLSLGSSTRHPNIPGLREHSYPIKSLADAMRLRDRAIQLLERANHCNDPDCSRALLRFVVVGGGPTGVETAGEFHQFLRTAARAYPNLSPDFVSMTLVDHAPRILSGFDEDLSDWAAEHLRRRGIDLHTSESVAEVSPTHVRLGTGQILPCHTTIWAAGIAPPSLLKSLDLPKDTRGYLQCDRDARVQGHPNLWAVGDCGDNPGPDGKPYPALAQHALREGQACADNIARVLRNQPTKPLELRSKGMIAAFGHHDAVAKVFRLKLTGFPAWWLFRTFYLLQMPGFGRKLRVALDWTLDLLFRPEPVSLGLVAPSRQVAPVSPSECREPNPPDRARSNPSVEWETAPDAERPTSTSATAPPDRRDDGGDTSS